MKFTNLIFSALHALDPTFRGPSVCRYNLRVEQIDTVPSLVLSIPSILWSTVREKLCSDIEQVIAHGQFDLTASFTPPNERTRPDDSLWQVLSLSPVLRLAIPLYSDNEYHLNYIATTLRWMLKVLNGCSELDGALANQRLRSLPKCQLIAARLDFAPSSVDKYPFCLALSPEILKQIRTKDDWSVARFLQARMNELGGILTGRDSQSFNSATIQPTSICFATETPGTSLAGHWKDWVNKSEHPGILLLGHNVSSSYYQLLLLLAALELPGILKLS